MKTRQTYIGVAAIAAILAVAALSTQSVHDAKAQQSTVQSQSETADESNQAQTTDRQAGQLQGQRQYRTDPQSADPNKQQWKASELIGLDVRAKTGDDEIGEISDVVIGPDGKVKYVAVSFGGFLGLGEKLFAVPWQAVQFVREGEDEDDIYARIDVTEQQLRTRRGFNEDNWPTKGDETFLRGDSREPRQVERPTTTPPGSNVPR